MVLGKTPWTSSMSAMSRSMRRQWNIRQWIDTCQTIERKKVFHTTVPLRLRASLESTKHAQLCMWKGCYGGDGVAEGRQKSSKKLSQDGVRAKRNKMDVLQGGIINNTVSSECRGEQWHCVEKRWRILLSFFSQTAPSINYFNVFIHYFMKIPTPRVIFKCLTTWGSMPCSVFFIRSVVCMWSSDFSCQFVRDSQHWFNKFYVLTISPTVW